MKCYNDNGNSRMIMIMAMIMVGREDSKKNQTWGNQKVNEDKSE